MRSLECVKLLIQSGANLKIACRDGRTVLDYAIQERGDECLSIIKYLIDTFDFQDSEKNDRRMHALHKACLARKDVSVNRVIDLLLENGEDIDALEGNGRYLIHYKLIRLS